MNNTLELRKIKNLGTFCAFASCLFTILLCLPLPIIYFFLKNTKSYFSVLDDFNKYLDGKIDIKTLQRRSKNIFYRLSFLSCIFLLVSYALFSSNSSNDFEMRGNLIFFFSFLFLLSPCFYLYFKVKEYLRSNEQISFN